MDNLITKSNFTGLISVVGTEQEWNETALDAYITLYQEILLKRFLGEHLYNLLDAGYNPLTNDKWKKLVDGDTYNYSLNGDDFTIKYKGLKQILAYFVYFFYKSEIATQNTDQGEVISANENSTVAKVDRKAIKAFNLGVDLLGEINNYDDIEYIEIGDFPFFLNRVSSDPLKPTLFNYIMYQNNQDSTTYPQWIFNGYSKINEFGI